MTAILSKQQKYTRPENTTRRGESSSSSSQSMRSQGSWCLRQHSNLESRRTFDNQIQPHSAPTSVALHQAENFRRFYRAVVSPTHVRVTAGGRIVPNTRAMAPPSFEPNGDKNSSESLQQINDTEKVEYNQAANNAAGDSQGPVIPLGAQGPPGFHHVFPGSFLPPYGYFPPGVANMPGQNYGHPGHTQLPNQSTNGNESSSNSLQPVRVSHPGQFDPSRPYMMVNNQMCFPASVFPQPPNGFPSGLMGNPPFGPPMLGGPPGHHMPQPIHGPVPFPMPPGNFPVPMMQHQNGQLFSMMSHQVHAQQPTMSQMLPLQVASTEQTLQQHRDHLMMLEDHIARQSLQSVPYWVTQRQVLMGEIARMTSLLQSERNQPHSDKNEKIQSGTSVDTGSSLDTPSTNKEARSPVIASSSASAVLRNQESSITCASSLTHTVRSADSPIVQRATTAKLGAGSRLPATAAMAPPFQPRGSRLHLSAAEWEEFARVTDPRPGGCTSPPATPENTTQRLARLMGNCQTRWEDSAAGSSMISMPRAQTMPAPQFQNHAASLPSFQRADTHPNSVAQMAQTSYGSTINSNGTSHQPYARVHTQSYDPERFLAQKEYFGNSANSLSNHSRQAPRFDTGKHTPMNTSPIRGNHNNQNAFTTDEYLNKCQSIFFEVSNESGVTKYASPWPSPMRNSTSHSAIDSRAKVAGSMIPFNLTTQSLANESGTIAHGSLSGEIVETPRKISADAQGLEILANVFAETPQKYLNPERKTATSFASENGVASVSTFNSTQAATGSLTRDHTSEDLGIIFASNGPQGSAQKQITKTVSTPLLTNNDLSSIFASTEQSTSTSPYKVEQDSTPSGTRPYASEDLGIISSPNELHTSAPKQSIEPHDSILSTNEDHDDIFASNAPQRSPSYKTEQASHVTAHTSMHLSEVFTSNSPVKNRRGITLPTYMNEDDIDDNKSIGSWTPRAENRTSTSTRSGNEKENMTVTPTTQDGSPRGKFNFLERIKSTSRYVEQTHR